MNDPVPGGETFDIPQPPERFDRRVLEDMGIAELLLLAAQADEGAGILEWAIAEDQRRLALHEEARRAWRIVGDDARRRIADIARINHSHIAGRT